MNRLFQNELYWNLLLRRWESEGEWKIERKREREIERIHGQLKYFCNRLKSKLLYILKERGIKYSPSTVESQRASGLPLSEWEKRINVQCKTMQSVFYPPDWSQKNRNHMSKKSRNAVLLWVSCGVQAQVQAKLWGSHPVSHCSCGAVLF